jgi:hypothetical protein
VVVRLLLVCAIGCCSVAAAIGCCSVAVRSCERSADSEENW